MNTATGYPELLRAFRLALTVQGLRPKTVRNYLSDVLHFSQACPQSPRSVTVTDIRAYVSVLQQRVSAKTVHEAQLAIRRFFRFLLQEREIRRDPTAEMKLARYRIAPQPTYSEADVKRMLLACDVKTREGLRNRAILLVLFDTGVREGELVSMGLPDWERRAVQVEGKTGFRTVFLGTAALMAVERYARRWGITDGTLWRGKKGTLTESGVHQLVRCLCIRAGIPNKGVHAFRRAAAAQMKRLGINDSDILEVMGWKDVTMLRRYTAAVAGELAQGTTSDIALVMP